MTLSANVLCAFLVAASPAGAAKARVTLAHNPHAIEQGSCPLAGPSAITMNIRFMRMADDYCNSRCNQRFDYCQYRRESSEHCTRELIRCRANC